MQALKRLRRLARRAYKALGLRPDVIVHWFPNKKEFDDLHGLIDYNGRRIMLAKLSCKGKAYTWRFLRSVLAHEIAHNFTGYQHTARFKRIHRRISALLRKLDS